MALIPAGWHHYGAFRSRYVVPAVAFVALGSALMIFSFRMVPFSFTRFVLDWWPLLVVLAGLTLVLVSLGTKNGAGEAKR
jgi:cell division protein FtsW (lipid II flippase)